LRDSLVLKAFALAHLDVSERELLPWFKGAVMQDAQSRELAEGATNAAPEPGSAEDPRAFMREVFRDGLLPAVRTSPVVYRAFLRWFNLLASPQALMSDGEVVTEVIAAYNDRDNRPPEPPLGPDRTTFVDALPSA
jgi:hypothetical protein